MRRQSSWPGCTRPRSATRSSRSAVASMAAPTAPPAPRPSPNTMRASDRFWPVSSTHRSATWRQCASSSTRKLARSSSSRCRARVAFEFRRKDFLQGLRQLADERELLLIFDEVQSGCGRTGKWFAYQHAGVEPDIMTLAKSLCGGIAGAAMLATAEVAASLRPGIHAATFGGNPIAARAGIATIETIEEEGLLERATQLGRSVSAAACSAGRGAADCRRAPRPRPHDWPPTEHRWSTDRASAAWSAAY